MYPILLLFRQLHFGALLNDFYTADQSYFHVSCGNFLAQPTRERVNVMQPYTLFYTCLFVRFRIVQQQISG